MLDDQQIEAAWRAGDSMTEIADMLGVTKGVIAGKIHRLGLNNLPDRPKKQRAAVSPTVRLRDEVIVLRSVILEWLREYDPERGAITVDADPRCLECTADTTPHHLGPRPCAFHTALMWVPGAKEAVGHA